MTTGRICEDPARYFLGGLTPALSKGRGRRKPLPSQLVGADPRVCPLFVPISCPLFGQTRGSAPTRGAGRQKQIFVDKIILIILICFR